MSVGEALGAVRQRVERAALACGRDPGSVRVVAVSKTKPAEAVREAYAAGQRAFGENYAQELAAKATALADLPDVEWHFVGHLQANKAKVVAKHAHVVHTVDSAALARELGRRVEREGRAAPLPVLIEVNVANEPQKAGVAAPDLAEVIGAVHAQGALVLRGLMAIPPAADPDEARKLFELVATLRSLHGGAAVLPELSMGMSADLEAAVAAGATIVRVGTAIFGARTP